ncbi:hypothetical protein DS67_04140 [Mesotoga sp. SC_4PWA21]|nr:hypothetical protein DS67_04140 [Mesotoga sp. SC_4PWA21]
MLITDNVNVPTELIRAQEEGRLVVFAGAGVSMASPSNIPGFVDLAKAVAKRYKQKYYARQQRVQPPDVFLGSLNPKREEEGVHEIVWQIMSEGNSTFFLARSTCIGCTEFTIVGNFDLDVPDTITVNLRSEPPEGGQVSGEGQFPKGSSTVISAMPNPGYGFSVWCYDPCGSVFSESQTLTLSNLQENISLFASFHPLN